MLVIFKRLIRYFIYPLALGLSLFYGCSKDEPALLLYAAASTTDAVKDIAEQFEMQTGLPVNINLSSSGTLAQQIVAGADPDVFLSANQKWVDLLKTKNLIAQTKDVLANKLVIVVPANSTLDINSPRDLLQQKISRIALGDPESVPAGMYAKQALQQLNLWDALEKRVVRALDVRQALMYIERGEVDAGIVYSTDASISQKVKITHVFSGDVSVSIRYPVVLIKTKANDPKANQLYDYFTSPDAKAIFQHYGFEILIE